MKDLMLYLRDHSLEDFKTDDRKVTIKGESFDAWAVDADVTRSFCNTPSMHGGGVRTTKTTQTLMLYVPDGTLELGERYTLVVGGQEIDWAIPESVTDGLYEVVSERIEDEWDDDIEYWMR